MRVERIGFLGKQIRVVAAKGPSRTVIDAERQGSVVTFRFGEGRNAVLDGFTLRGGSGSPDPKFGDWNSGGGIFCDGASPRIEGNVIADNAVTLERGGIFVPRGGAPHIVGNTITRNVALVGDELGRPVRFEGGGGIACRGAPSGSRRTASSTTRCPSSKDKERERVAESRASISRRRRCVATCSRRTSRSGAGCF